VPPVEGPRPVQTSFTGDATKERVAKAFLLVAVTILAVVVLWMLFGQSDEDEAGEPAKPAPTPTATATQESTSDPMEESPATMPAEEKEMPKADEGMAMGAGAARKLDDAAEGFLEGYVAWSYGAWKFPPGFYAIGSGTADLPASSGWAGPPSSMSEVQDIVIRRVAEGRARARARVGDHDVLLVLARHEMGRMRNWLGISVPHHDRPIWRVVAVADGAR
jgi:hypothetical protein